jgi:hypothetical protein
MILASLALVLVAAVAVAQQPAAGPARAEVRIRDVPRMGRSALVRTPEFQNNVKRTGSGVRRREWALFDVSYETAPEWVDEVGFTFHVMTQDAQRQFNYFETSVTYIDLARGDHNACVVLPPAAVARYGEPTAFGVEIFLRGERVALKSVGAPDDWWKLIADKPNIHRRPGYLVDRSKTPFALAFIDDYEVVR